MKQHVVYSQPELLLYTGSVLIYVACIIHIICIYLYTKTSLAFRQFPTAHRIRLLLIFLARSIHFAFCLIARSLLYVTVCDEKPVHKIDDDSDGDGDGDDYNGWFFFFEDMNRVKS